MGCFHPAPPAFPPSRQPLRLPLCGSIPYADLPVADGSQGFGGMGAGQSAFIGVPRHRCWAVRMFAIASDSIQFPCNCGSVRVNRHDEVVPILGLADAEPALPAITVIANPEPLLFSQFYGLPQCLRSANVNLGSCKPVVG